MSGLLNIDNEALRRSFDRDPVQFSHGLNELGLLKIDSLHALATKMADSGDYFLAQGARAPDEAFFSVPRLPAKPAELIERLDEGEYRILLKRAENHDNAFRDLINTLFGEVVRSVDGLEGEKIVRLESGILISSGNTITPFHCDHEIGYFSQIEGEKIYHVFSPTAITEPERERFSIAGPVGLAPLDLSGRDPAREYVFNLIGGKGFHQPQNSPHWVKTGKSRSISYTFVFETEASRAAARTRAFNHYLRKLGIAPATLGRRPTADSVKASVMRAVTPVRGLAANIAERTGLR
jgi:hypothetical protein